VDDYFPVIFGTFSSKFCDIWQTNSSGTGPIWRNLGLARHEYYEFLIREIIQSKLLLNTVWGRSDSEGDVILALQIIAVQIIGKWLKASEPESPHTVYYFNTKLYFRTSVEKSKFVNFVFGVRKG